MRPTRPTTARPLAAAALAGAVSAGAPPALAEEGFLLRLALEGGGDELGTAVFTDGETESIEAGGAVHFEAGFRGAFAGPAWESDLTVGFKTDSVDADNGELAFERVTLNAMQYFRLSERVRLGAGVTYHLSPELEADLPSFGGGRIDGTFEADDALGFMVAVDYLVGSPVEIGIRATQIDYEFELGDDEIDGSSTGVYLGVRF